MKSNKYLRTIPEEHIEIAQYAIEKSEAVINLLHAPTVITLDAQIDAFKIILLLGDIDTASVALESGMINDSGERERAIEFKHLMELELASFSQVYPFLDGVPVKEMAFEIIKRHCKTPLDMIFSFGPDTPCLPLSFGMDRFNGL